MKSRFCLSLLNYIFVLNSFYSKLIGSPFYPIKLLILNKLFCCSSFIYVISFSYQPPPVKPFDWWSFKKSILHSLLQAVKAITGGVIALNGQLVKVKGHIMAAKGHLLSTKGDSITSFGKHLATHAFATAPGHADIHDAGPSVPTGLYIVLIFFPRIKFF